MKPLILSSTQNIEYGCIRSVFYQNQHLFCGSDAMKALGYGDASRAAYKYCNNKISLKVIARGYIRKMIFINLFDLCRLTAKSQTKNAQAFKSLVLEKLIDDYERSVCNV